jgi:hypothetical protein
MLRRRVRRQGTFGRAGACERRHRHATHVCQSGGGQPAHIVSLPSHLRCATRDRRPRPLSGAMARDAARPRAYPRRGSARRDGGGARASHRRCRGWATRRGRSHARRPRAPCLMRAQDDDRSGDRLPPTSAWRHRDLIVQPVPIPRCPVCSASREPGNSHRHALGAGRHDLYERSPDFWDRTVWLKVPGRRQPDVG